jgi:hypothetical protein
VFVVCVNDHGSQPNKVINGLGFAAHIIQPLAARSAYKLEPAQPLKMHLTLRLASCMAAQQAT